MADFQKILLVLDRSWGSQRAIIRGLREFAAKRRWFLRIARSTGKLSPDVREWKPDGVIACSYSAADHDELTGLCDCVVEVASRLELRGPRVDGDDDAAGRLAARYFKSLGLSRLAFVGFVDREFIAWRRSGFVDEGRRLGLPVECFESAHPRVGDRQWQARYFERAVLAWLKDQPGPVGLFAADAWVGWSVSQVCAFGGVRIPEDVAVISVEDDDTLCLISHPPLTSVQMPFERLGFEAGRMLLRLMRGGDRRRRPRRLGPTGIVERGSTDFWCSREPDLGAALRVVRERVDSLLQVDELAKAVDISRRRLQTLFTRHLGRSPYQEITRARVAAIGQELRASRASLKVVSRQFGFASLSHFSTYFRRYAGMSPSGYRAAQSPGG